MFAFQIRDATIMRCDAFHRTSEGPSSIARRLGDNGRKHVELNLPTGRIGSDMKRVFEETICSREVT